MQKMDSTWKVLQKRFKKDVENVAKSFHMTLKQTRQKFRLCVQECQVAAPKTKTTSGIKRFQESKDYGQWFNKLMQYISTIVSCQREQAIELSATMNHLEFSSYTPSSNSS